MIRLIAQRLMNYGFMPTTLEWLLPLFCFQPIDQPGPVSVRPEVRLKATLESPPGISGLGFWV